MSDNTWNVEILPIQNGTFTANGITFAGDSKHAFVAVATSSYGKRMLFGYGDSEIEARQECSTMMEYDRMGLLST